jgi:histidine-binding protein
LYFYVKLKRPYQACGLFRTTFQENTVNIRTHLLSAICATMMLAGCGGQSVSSANDSAASGIAAGSGEKVLRVATNAEFAPFESLDENKNIQGFDIDLMNALAKEGGFKVEFTHQPWESLFPALANGDVDVLASAVTITDDRKKTMLFSDPYYQISQVVLVPKGKDVKSVDDLKKLNKVGVVTGQTGDLAVQKILGNTSDKIARFKTVTLLMEEIGNGGVDAAVSDSAVVAHYAKNNSDKGYKLIKLDGFDVENYGFAMRPGDTETAAKLNDALKKIKENGEYAKIESKYFAQ